MTEPSRTPRRIADGLLCAAPLLAVALAGVRVERPGATNLAIGAVLFVLVACATWLVGARRLAARKQTAQRLAAAGTLLVLPFALIVLFWVGLGPPWEATLPENRMRYVVLLADAMAVAAGFVVLAALLRDAGERFHASLASAANLLATIAYLVWMSLQAGAYTVALRDGELSPVIVALTDLTEVLLFVACVATYLATAAFAASLACAGWLGRGSARIYIALALAALVFIVVRGLSFPDPSAGNSPWYLRPGFIAGIPAIPWLMPYYLGLVALRRAGAEPSDAA